MSKNKLIQEIKRIAFGSGCKIPSIPSEDMQWLRSKGFTMDAYETGKCIIVLHSRDLPRAREILKDFDSRNFTLIIIRNTTVNEKNDINT